MAEKINNTLFIDLKQSHKTDDINFCKEGDLCDFVVVDVCKFDKRLVELLIRLRDIKCPVILLIEYLQTPFAQKLKDMQLVDGFTVSPLSDAEMERFLSAPADCPYDNQNTPQKRIRQLEQIAYTDRLTGIWNRRFMDNFLSSISRQASGLDVKMSLLLLDIDNLKDYNDRFGHKAGDKLISDTAVALQRCFRQYDVCGRIGGDEFAAVLWQLPQTAATDIIDNRRRKKADFPNNAEIIAERLQKYTRQDAACGKTTISGSVIDFDNSIKAIDDIFEQADKKLYEAKRQGKNVILK